jgi:hypothetical protein
MRSGNAITSRGEDRLGRTGFADRLAAELRLAPADEGLLWRWSGRGGAARRRF